MRYEMQPPNDPGVSVVDRNQLVWHPNGDGEYYCTQSAIGKRSWDALVQFAGPLYKEEAVAVTLNVSELMRLVLLAADNEYDEETIRKMEKAYE